MFARPDHSSSASAGSPRSATAEQLVARTSGRFKKPSWKALKKFWVLGLGPFPAGETEFDADPVEAYGGPLWLWTVWDQESSGKESTTSGKRGPEEFRLASELVEGGYSRGWTKLLVPKVPSDNEKSIVPLQISWSKNVVDWNRVMQGLHSIEAASFQAWVIGEFKAQEDGRSSLHCSGVHSFYVVEEEGPNIANANNTTSRGSGSSTSAQSRHLFSGDIYQTGHVYSLSMRLKKNVKYLLYFKITAKFQARFYCRVRRPMLVEDFNEDIKEHDEEDKPDEKGAKDIGVADYKAVELLRKEHVFDFLDGDIPFSPALGGLVSVIGFFHGGHTGRAINDYLAVKSLPIFVTHVADVSGTLGVADFEVNVDDSASATYIAPGQTFSLPLRLRFRPKTKNSEQGTFEKHFFGKEREKCLQLTLGLVFGDSVSSDVHQESRTQLSFDCRHSAQSFLFTFLDHDGTVMPAAAASPSTGSCRSDDVESECRVQWNIFKKCSRSGTGEKIMDKRRTRIYESLILFHLVPNFRDV